MFFDTHCHLYDNQFNEDQEEIILEALKKGVNKMLIPSDSLPNAIKCLKLANQYEFVYCAVGVHPSEIGGVESSLLKEEIISLVNSSSKVKAIGEVGLDYYWHKEKEIWEKQKEIFKLQIQIANDLKLPIIVHSRDALNDTLNVLEECPPLYGCVFHCYSYSEEVLSLIMKRGYYIGLDGPVTYKNAIMPKKVAFKVPLERLLVETDSPYLTPVPFRGKRNDPSKVVYIVEEIARIKNISVEEVAKATYQNALKFFNIGE